MTPAGGPLRVALVHHAPAAACVGQLEEALRAAGHRPRVVAPAPLAPVERVLRARGFTRPLSHAPLVAAALARGAFDVVHAFTVADAAVALAVRPRPDATAPREALRPPVVFAPAEPLDRARVADARLRLRLLERVLAGAHAVTAPSEASRAALERWLAVDAPLVLPCDAGAHERLYRSVLARRGSG